MKSIKVWLGRLGLFGVFYWCSAQFENWQATNRHQIMPNCMIWISALMVIHCLIYLTFAFMKEKQSFGWQFFALAALVFIRLWVVLGNITADAVPNEVLMIELNLLPGILVMHGVIQIGCNIVEYLWRNPRSVQKQSLSNAT